MVIFAVCSLRAEIHCNFGVRGAMPFDAPGSLDADDVYSLVTYLLQENQIVAPGVQLDQDNLADIKMPSRDRFVPDDRRGGGEIR